MFSSSVTSLGTYTRFPTPLRKNFYNRIIQLYQMNSQEATRDVWIGITKTFRKQPNKLALTHTLKRTFSTRLTHFIVNTTC